MTTRRRRRNKSRTRTWNRAPRTTVARDPRVGNMALWIMTPFGVLMPSKRPAKLLADGDDRTLQVRARRKEYLDRFRETFCPELGDNEHTPTQDYQWKAPVSPEALALALARMALEIDSEKFKPLAEDSKYALKDKKLASELHNMYMSLWSSQVKYGDGTSSYDHAAKGIDLCARLGHWWPKYRRFCTDCGTPRPEGSPLTEGGPNGVKPTKEEVAEWHVLSGKGQTVAGWTKLPSGAWQAGESYVPAGGTEAAEDLPLCAKWGHYWPVGAATCTYCDTPRPDGTDGFQDVTQTVNGNIYIDSDLVGQADQDGTGWQALDPDAESSCLQYGHVWSKYAEGCTYCGEERPEEFPFDVELSGKYGVYYADGMPIIHAVPSTTADEETSPGEVLGERAPTLGAEKEEKADA